MTHPLNSTFLGINKSMNLTAAPNGALAKVPLDPFPTAVLTSLPTVLPLPLPVSSCVILSLTVCKSCCTVCRTFSSFLSPFIVTFLSLFSGLLLVFEAFFHFCSHRLLHVIVVISSFLAFRVKILLSSLIFQLRILLASASTNFVLFGTAVSSAAAS